MKWYIYRLRSMSAFELLYRVGQLIRKYLEKYTKPGWKADVKLHYRKNTLLKIDASCFPLYDHQISVFGKKFDYSSPINWHMDIDSMKTFPLTFSKSINIRDERYGSAKFVWEINRMTFLPKICLNYMKTGNREYLALFENIITSWNNDNPYLIGVNWYSNIEINIRLINWFICWEILQAHELIDEDSEFKNFVNTQWFPAIYLHCHYSFHNPSKYSSANNHLISEHAGLFIATSLWSFHKSSHWNKIAKKGLEKEILKQHSSNGINKEEAAEYIQFITDFFLLSFIVGDANGNKFSPDYAGMLKKIMTYILNFTDMQGHFPQYGDEDDGRVIILEENQEAYNNFKSLLTSAYLLFGDLKFLTKAYFENDYKNILLFGKKKVNTLKALDVPDEGPKSVFYPDEGHFLCKKRGRDFKEIYMHIDGAPLGFLSIAAHGHADALSFILKIDGNDFLVDSGTYTYHTGIKWRKYFISTLAHNTITINSKNQAMNAGPTLWLNHYRTRVLKSNTDNSKDFVKIQHNGYRNIGATHTREFILDNSTNNLHILDHIELKKKTSLHIECPLHFHPEVNIEKVTGNIFDTRRKHIRCMIEYPEIFNNQIEIIKGQTNPVLGWYSPSFYQKMKTNVLYGRLSIDKSISFKTKIELLKAE